MVMSNTLSYKHGKRIAIGTLLWYYVTLFILIDRKYVRLILLHIIIVSVSVCDNSDIILTEIKQSCTLFT